MSKALRQFLFWPALLVLLLFTARPGLPKDPASAEPTVREPRPPRIFPDYSQTVLPPNIAPLSFKVEEPGRRYKVHIRGSQGESIPLLSRSSSVEIPPKAWHALLRTNVGGPLYFDVSVEDEQRQWRQFQPITNSIAREEIDGYLVYRLLRPLYNVYVHLGIYQRDLHTFDEKPVLQNQSFGGGCLNCHTFLNHRADTFALHVRTETNLHPMLLVRSNEAFRVDKTMGYLSWHPSGRLLAFSANKLSMFFHTTGETRDVFDADSNLGIYQIDSNQVMTPPAIAQADRNETWPAWSPDGRFLYYCSAPKLPFAQFRSVRYDVMRAPYDADANRWGEPETLVSAGKTGLSAGQPRPSPDGRWLLFCLYQYGNFPVYQPSSDLYVLDLSSRQYRRLAINSDQADSWHSWSSNSRWIVLSSKRLDGLFARPHFSYVDEQGQFHKPLLLPQKDPVLFKSYLNTINVPELIRDPVRMEPAILGRTVTRPRQVLTPRVDSPQEHREQ